MEAFCWTCKIYTRFKRWTSLFGPVFWECSKCNAYTFME